MIFSSLLNEIKRYFIPFICISCGAELYQKSHFFCRKCLATLPKTGYEKQEDNACNKLFSGRLPVKQAFALLFFAKKGQVQEILHEIKYKNNRKLGAYMGYLMGKALLDNPLYNDIDVIIPLPLNRKKLKQRGYNQSSLLCYGIASVLHKPVEEIAVVRSVYTQTQTRKNRIQRWLNVEQVFDLENAKHLEGKHALLVDDVITTGATMEACGNVLLSIPGLRLSIASLAMATKA
ncbi:MAG: ComF family protein [Chitinophagaceae bacterium]|jgi:ComF family protein|nr:ComF family protein [Chitinophagaceae bacterium]